MGSQQNTLVLNTTHPCDSFEHIRNMAEESLANAQVNLDTNGRKRSLSEATDKYDHKKAAIDVSDVHDELFGQYPYNVKKTCILHDHTGDQDDPQGHKCADFESEFGNYDSNIFIDQNEAEELLATLEWAPAQPPPLPLDYQYPPMLGWNGQPDLKGNLTEQNPPVEAPTNGTEEKLR